MRVYEMIADLRLFARPPQPELQPVALVELVDGLIAELSPLAAQAGHRASARGRRRADFGHGRPDATGRGLRALCQNAIEALGGQGHIRIELGRGRARWRFASATTGPASRPSSARTSSIPSIRRGRRAAGLGLGLSKCWRIITNHGGRIAVEEQPGGGACFLITLPRPPASASRRVDLC